MRILKYTVGCVVATVATGSSVEPYGICWLYKRRYDSSAPCRLLAILCSILLFLYDGDAGVGDRAATLPGRR